jgi:60 kDa SS-A/Ro ribonucleoprotein
MIRNLGKMSSIELFTPMGEAEKLVVSKLNDEEYIHKSRVHPFSILLASTTYASGHGVRGSLIWKPNRAIKDALDKAFYLAFKNVEPTGKNYYLAIDVSGSMGARAYNTSITCMEASAAMAMAIARTEENWYAAGFATAANGELGGRWTKDQSRLLPLNISPEQSLQSVCSDMKRIPMGGTDCALPMLDALEKKIFVDTFIVFTDNETWAGKIHPVQALKKYRKAMNPNAKLVVMGMTLTNFTIADPKDPGMLDLVGLDSSAPQLIANFTRGDI